MRPIDADALLKNTKAYFRDCIDKQDSEIIDNTILVHNKNISKIIRQAPTVEKPRGEWISVEDRLPEENVAVLIWSGSISIAKLEKGITMAEREAMKKGEIDDPESEGWNLYDGWFWIKRSDSIRACDEWGNNLKPYCWEAVGSVGQHFGQDVKYWMPLPQKPDMRGEGE